MPYKRIHPWRRCYRQDDAVDKGKLCVISASSRYVVEEWDVVFLEWQK